MVDRKKDLELRISDIPNRNNTKLIEFVGEVDTLNSYRITQDILPLIEQGYRIIICDFSELYYIESSGIYNLIRCYARVKEKKGAIRIVSPQDSVKEVLVSLGVPSLIPIFESMEIALECRDDF